MNDLPKLFFPFGQQLKKVEQKNKTPKKAFVLGVYASAVHAQWKDKNGKQKVAALAVASEPEIFWTGNEAEGNEIIAKINIPAELGTLSFSRLNGPSGQALDELYLEPLGLTRDNTWLSDLLPEARINPSQKKAIDREYSNIAKAFGLPEVTIPDFKTSELDSASRREEILKELEMSGAETLILLGDLPIKKFLKFYSGQSVSNLAGFCNEQSPYGTSHEMKINGKHYQIIPLCHPRQAARLGRSSSDWGIAHDNWIKSLNCTY